MQKLLVFGAACATFVAGCASMGEQASPQMSECLQPNRRVVVEVGGRTLKPPPKPVPGKPAPKPGKPAYAAVADLVYVQGNSAFDVGGAVLKQGGKADLDKLVASLGKRKVMVSSVIVSGHTDRFEAAAGNEKLSEERAKAVKDYLASKGVDQKLIFWEGKAAREPVPVTKFCQ